mmetsp:Transcript_25690/g.51119  ORF Transcript_25690/g.51119 Transcript_25690/m.51119 type:complete len:510 (-) Transcript_25690:32-1561(-)
MPRSGHRRQPNRTKSPDRYTHCRRLAKDMSPLLFNVSPPAYPLPYVGAVHIVETPYGRGLAVSRSVEVGECLMILRPAVFADVSEVFRRFPDCRVDACGDAFGRSALEIAAEEVLQEKMEHVIKKADFGSKDDIRRSAAVLSLRGNGNGEDKSFRWPGRVTQEILLETGKIPSGAPSHPDTMQSELLAITRRNVFGPEFHPYSRMMTACGLFRSSETYPRILSHYPLAAMINHGCSPNAARFFRSDAGGEIMVVHAARNIEEGEEIFWSYVPVASGKKERDAALSSHDFVCDCRRCREELKAGHLADELQSAAEGDPAGDDDTAADEVEELLEKIKIYDNSTSPSLNPPTMDFESARTTLYKMEALLLRASGPLRLYLQAGMYKNFIECFNRMLETSGDDDTINSGARTIVLRSAAGMHLALHTVHPGSTEHLAVLHLCYDLVGIEHCKNPTERSQKKVRFWTEQLKKAHIARYGRLGNNLDSIRMAMKHTKGILRDKDGWKKATYKFI